MNVAQLKHLIAQRMGRDDAGFPRLNERGSIEAAPQPQGQLPPNWFPRLNERGSIEDVRAGAVVPVGARGFPRLNERGSIEASRARESPPCASPVSTFE